MSPDIEYKVIKPSPGLSDFVESFWMLTNHSKEKKEVVIVPDGRFDIFFSKSATEPYHVTLSGLATEPSQSSLEPQSTIFAISFNLLAAEYLLHNSISSLLNVVHELPVDFWEMSSNDLKDFD